MDQTKLSGKVQWKTVAALKSRKPKCLYEFSILNETVELISFVLNYVTRFIGRSNQFNLLANQLKIQNSTKFSKRRFSLSVSIRIDEGASSLLAERNSAEKKCAEEIRTRVGFSEVHIREYPTVVGVNPGGFKGVPVTIGWEPVSSTSLPLEEYEVQREGHRRAMKHLRIASSIRESRLLKHLGFSRTEMNWGLKRANIARRQRRQTLYTLRYSKSHEWIETMGRALRDIVTLGGRQRLEKKLLIEAKA